MLPIPYLAGMLKYSEHDVDTNKWLVIVKVYDCCCLLLWDWYFIHLQLQMGACSFVHGTADLLEGICTPEPKAELVALLLRRILQNCASPICAEKEKNISEQDM